MCFDLVEKMSFVKFRPNGDGDGDEPTEDELSMQNQWISFGSRVAIRIALHPFEYAKVLIQLGYEPIKPRMGKTLFGQPALVYPNVFQYAAYIRTTDGLAGCYRGLTPRLLGAFLGAFGAERIADKLKLDTVTDEEAQAGQTNDAQLYKNYDKKLKRELAITAAEVLLSQPFQVISIRIMAQFVGQETQYSGIFGSFQEVIAQEGIKGLWSGVVPRLLNELGCVLLVNATSFMICKYLIKDPVAQAYSTTLTSYVFQSVFYPFQVVSACMAVSGTNLLAGRPPHMPTFGNWRDCWSHLASTGGLKRGNSLFFRYARSSAPSKVKAIPFPDMPPMK